MVRKALIAIAAMGFASSANADSNTTCRRTLMGGMDCTTTSSEHPADAGNRAMQEGINSLSAAIAARAERKREEKRLAALPPPTPAAPPRPMNFGTGNSFLASCAPRPATPVEFGMCLGFVDGLIAREFLFGKSPICLPDSVTRNQLLDVMTASIQANPEDRHYSAAALSLIALRDAFPCPVAEKTPTPPKP